MISICRHHANINVGDVVNIVGDFNDDKVCRVTNDENFVVVNPDILVSGTSVVSSVGCMRR